MNTTEYARKMNTINETLELLLECTLSQIDEYEVIMLKSAEGNETRWNYTKGILYIAKILLKLQSCEGNVCEMGITPNMNDEPLFYIKTDKYNTATVPMVDSIDITSVMYYLDSFNTGIKIFFNNFLQFNALIESVFAKVKISH